jgi:pyruvyl transferase EpsO
MTNINESKIINLKNKIKEALTPLIDSDYALLDVPDHENIGDNLIWEGELHFLNEISFKNKYEASIFFFEQKKIPKDAIIIFHGGGNFGDIYKKTNQERLKIIAENHDKKIIIFPQTIFYQDYKNLIEDAKIINAHPNLTLCVRDHTSLKIAEEHFLNITTLLLPDMAFCLDLSIFKSSEKANKTLFMKRRDSELNERTPQITGDYDSLDWPTFNMPKEEKWKIIGRQRKLDKIAMFMQDIPILKSFVDSRYGIKSRKGKEKYIETGVEFFNQYETIYTTRLHGLILGVLMGKDMKVLDNSYGKLSDFYEAWLKDFDKVELIDY